MLKLKPQTEDHSYLQKQLYAQLETHLLTKLEICIHDSLRSLADELNDELYIQIEEQLDQPYIGLPKLKCQTIVPLYNQLMLQMDTQLRGSGVYAQMHYQFDTWYAEVWRPTRNQLIAICRTQSNEITST